MITFYYIFLMGCTAICQISSASNISHRQKRFIVYPRGGSFKIVIGIGIPVKLGSKQSMAIGWNLQMQYAVPQNASQLVNYPPIYTGRKRRDNSDESEPLYRSDRAIFYKAFENVFDNEGIDGRQCLLRSICENAMDSVAHEANGLYGELFNIVLTPSYGDGEISDDLDPVYLEAQRAGEFGVDCQTLYSNCMLSDGLLGLFTILDNKFS